MHDMMQRNYTYYRRAIQGRRLPCALVDLELFDENARQIRHRAGDKKIRLASKSVRCRELLQRILNSDSQFRGLMCFSAEEAVWLSRQGFDDILIAYPVWQTEQIGAVAAEVSRGRRLLLMVDSEAQIERISRVAAQTGVTLLLCLDVDMSSDFPGLHFGAWRSGIQHLDQVRRLVQSVREQPYVELRGVMGYEGQIAGVGDNTPGQFLKNLAIRGLQWYSRRQVRRRRQAIVEVLKGEGVDLWFVNAGGTGSLESSSAEPWVSEVTAGSGFFAPALFDTYRRFRHLPAALFAIEITRRPRPDIFTCLGGGYIASGPAGWDRLPQPYLPAGACLIKTEGAGEVQTPIRYRGPEKLDYGDPIFFRHAKAGELCERFDRLYLIAAGEIVDEVPTYRGEGKCFF